MKPLIQDEKTNEKPYHAELKAVAGSTGYAEERGGRTNTSVKVLRDGELGVGNDDESSLRSGVSSFTGGGGRTFQSNNRSSYNNKSSGGSFNESFNRNSTSGKVSFNDGNRTSLNDSKR